MDLHRRVAINKIFSTDLEKVTIAGWVQQVRNLGGLKFLQLQDRSGVVHNITKKESEFREF